jgi:hypothetical protein
MHKIEPRQPEWQALAQVSKDNLKARKSVENSGDNEAQGV